MDVLHPTRLTFPTDNPEFGEAELTKSISDRLRAVGKGRAGAALTAGRAAGEHLQVLQKLMSGSTFTRLDLTPGATLTAMLGSSRVNIPTFGEISRSVNIGGVKYAPQLFAQWDGNKYGIVGPEASLGNQLETLLHEGYRDVGLSRQVTAMRGRLNQWRDQSVQHIRFGIRNAGGAQPWFLSHTANVRANASGQAGPLYEKARQVEEMVGQNIGSVIKNRLVKSQTPGIYAGSVVAGMEEHAYSMTRDVLRSHLALGLMAFEPGSSFQSVHGKDLRLKADDIWGKKRFNKDKSGRLSLSTLPTHGYGLVFPEQNLPKSIHHLRAAQAMSFGEIQGIKAGTGVRATMPIRSAYDIAAQGAAGAHMEEIGRSGEHLLRTPVRGLSIEINPALTEAQQKIGRTVLSRMIGESGVLAASPEMAKLAALNQQWSSRSVALARNGRDYLTGMLHPEIAKRIEGKAGGYVAFDRPVTFSDLHAVGDPRLVPPSRIPRGTNNVAGLFEWETEHPQGFLGASMTNTGEVKVGRHGQPVRKMLGETERIHGVTLSQGKLTYNIEDTAVQTMERGNSMIFGGGQRTAFQGYLAAPGHDLIFAGSEGLGLDVAHPDFVLHNLTTQIEQKHGVEGLHEVARAMDGVVKVNEAGEHEIVLGLEKRTAKHLANVEEIAKKYGIDAGPLVSGPYAELMKRAGPQSAALLAKHGMTPESTFLARSTSVMAMKRAGQPTHGTFGTVSYRLRDLRTQSTGWMSESGLDFAALSSRKKGAWRNLKGLAQKYSKSGATDSRVERGARDLSKYFNAAGRVARRTDNPLVQYAKLQAYAASAADPRYAATKGDLRILDGMEEGVHYKRLSAEEFRKRFVAPPADLKKGAGIEQFRGTSLVRLDERRGIEVADSMHYLVDMPSKGMLPGSRQNPTGSYVNSVVVPSGETHFRSQQPVSLSKASRENLTHGSGYWTLETHRALSLGAEDNAVYRASGAGHLANMETVSANTGRGLYKSGGELKSSFTGTLVADSTLKYGERGLAENTVREMLEAAGERGERLERRMKLYKGRQATTGSSGFKVATKIREPATSAMHYQVSDIRILPNEDVSLSDGTKISNRRAIAIHPDLQTTMYGDFDPDSGSVGLLTGTDRGAGKISFSQEQRALTMLQRGSQNSERALQLAQEESLITGSLKGRRIPVSLDHYKQMIDEAEVEAQKMIIGRKLIRSAATDMTALSATMAWSPSTLTAVTNLRHRRRMQLLQDVTMGNGDVSKLIYRGGGENNIAAAKAALDTIKSNAAYAEFFPQVAEASTYAGALKKTSTQKTLAGATQFAELVDPRLAALSQHLGTLGADHPGLTQALTETSDAVVKLMGEAQGNPLVAQAIKMGMAPDAAGVTAEMKNKIGLGVANLMHATGVLEHQGFQSAIEPMMRNPEGASRTAIHSDGTSALLKYLGSDAQLDLAHDASAHGGVAAGSLSREAAGAGEDALRSGGTKTMKEATLGFAREGKALAEKLWNSKFGKPIILTGGALTLFGMGKALFGSSNPGYAPAGAPMPPGPAILGNNADRDMQIDLPRESYARIQRVSQVRTHMQVTGITDKDFASSMDLASTAFGRHGRMPVQGGQFINASSNGMAEREKARDQIRSRFKSDF